MIHRTRFIHRCKAEGFASHCSAVDPMFWRVPYYYVLWWDNEQALILPNNADALALGARRQFAFATFDDLDEVIATYQLLNP